MLFLGLGLFVSIFSLNCFHMAFKLLVSVKAFVEDPISFIVLFAIVQTEMTANTIICLSGFNISHAGKQH